MFSSRHHLPEVRYEAAGAALVGAMALGALVTYAFMRSRMAPPQEIVDDSSLAERVRAAMAHVVPDPMAIDVRARDGCVTLKGPVDSSQVGELVACAGRVRGVRAVDNRLSISNPS